MTTKLQKHDKLSPVLESKSAEISALAGEIWREYYTSIIGAEQVEYMLAKFQSPERIYADIKESGCVYFKPKKPNKKINSNPPSQERHIYF